MKKIALLSLFLINTSYAVELTSYQDAVDALNNGKRITYVVDWDRCKISIPDVKPNFSSNYSPSAFNIAKNGVIQSRDMTYSHDIKGLPQLGPVNQAYDYRFTKNNELHVINRFLDPVTYAEKMPPVEVTCQLGEGFKVYG